VPDAPSAALQSALNLHKAGKLQEAEAFYRRIIEAEPRNADAFYGLGVLQGDLGRFEEAAESFRGVVSLQPDHPGAYRSLGLTLMELGQPEAAEPSFRQALALSPNAAPLHLDLADALAALARWPEAEERYRRALSLDGKMVLAHIGLGNALRQQGELKHAESSYRRALKLDPTAGRAHAGLGFTFFELGRSQEAEQCYVRAIALDPSYPTAHGSLAQLLARTGRLAEAEHAYRRALELNPDFREAHSSLIFALDLMPTTDTRAQQEERARWYEQHARKHAPPARLHPNNPDPERKLRVGYVSADFKLHSAYYVFSPMIYRHDRAAFEVFCYSGVKHEDDTTTRLRQAVDGWRSTLGVSDDALAEQIRRDGIDILVDLSGHSEGHRLLVFARKPAPVQVTAWGHATGTGLKTIDYFFADPLLVPPIERQFYAEKIFDLPSALCYEAPPYAPEVSALPAAKGNPFTFGCVNRLEKITDNAIALWGRILSSTHDSRLLVKDRMLGDLRLRQQFLRRLRDIGGIAPERASLFGPTSHAEQLAIFGRIDVGLDPFPQNGGVSTAEALYMGVPVVALRGTTVPSRITASVLNLMQMKDWVAETGDDYVRIAVEKSEDLDALADLRRQLRTRFTQSPYGDVENYVRAVEKAYRSMWRSWCDRARNPGP